VELNPATLVVSFTRDAVNGLLLVGITSEHVVELPTYLTDITGNAVRRISNTKFVVVAAGPVSPRGLYLVDLDTKDKKLLKSTTSIPMDSSLFSPPQAISFPRTRGKYLEGLSHAMFIPPFNPLFSAPSDSKPPLIVSIHGGPTSTSKRRLSPTIAAYLEKSRVCPPIC
jgi:dipeptidyl aminopeptidase/acylaminoacyl peptidase